MTLMQDGLFNSMRGLSSVVGGRLVGPVLNALSNRSYTALWSATAMLHFLIKASARTPAAYMSCLVPYVLGAGNYRSAAVNAQLVRFALAAGLKEGETAACQANFQALLKMLTPFLYSSMYERFLTSRLPGAPYLLCLGFMALAQAATMTLSAAEMGDAPEP